MRIRITTLFVLLMVQIDSLSALPFRFLSQQCVVVKYLQGHALNTCARGSVPPPQNFSKLLIAAMTALQFYNSKQKGSP